MKHTGETGAGDTVNTKKYNVRFSAADVVIIHCVLFIRTT